jgi:hypothetical protein
LLLQLFYSFLSLFLGQLEGKFVHAVTLDGDLCDFMFPVDISTLRGENLHDDESLNYFHFKTPVGSVRLVTSVFPPVSREVRFFPPNHILFVVDRKDVPGGQLSVSVSRLITNECMGCGHVIKKYKATGFVHACPHCVSTSGGETVPFNLYCCAGCRWNHLSTHAREACRVASPPEIVDRQRDVQEGRVRNPSLPGESTFTLPAIVCFKFPQQPLDSLRTLASAALTGDEVRQVAGALNRPDDFSFVPKPRRVRAGASFTGAPKSRSSIRKPGTA